MGVKFTKNLTTEGSDTSTIEIIHVDDDPDHLAISKRMIEKFDPSLWVDTTSSQDELLSNLESCDCIILDYVMPPLDGIELSEKVREMSDIPIILYTGQGSEEVAEKAFSVGINDYIRKENELDHYRVLVKRIRMAVEHHRAEEALRDSEEKLRNIFTASPDVIIVSDLKGVILDCNPAALDLHGYSSKREVIGRSAFEFISERDQNRALENFKQLFERGSLKDIEYAFLTSEGREFPALLSASVIKDSLGKPCGFVAVTKDITPRKGYQKRLEALHLHASELPSAETIEEVSDLTFKAMEQVLGFNHASFGVVEDELLHFIHLWGLKDEGFELHLEGPGITVRAVRTGVTQLVPDIRLDEDYVAGPGGIVYGTLSELDIPIKIEGEVVAVINIESEKLNAFTEMDKELVEIFAEHVASAMSRLRYIEELKVSREELERSNYELRAQR